MVTPKDNTEVMRMLRDFKGAMWKSVTPLKTSDRNFKDFAMSHASKTGCSSVYLPKIATRLNFTGMDDTPNISDSTLLTTFQTPDSMKRKLENAEVELQVSKAKLSERDSMISMMEPSNKKLCQSLETKLELAKKQAEIDQHTILKLTGKLKCSQNEALYAKSQVHDLERQNKIDNDKMEMKLLSLHTECSNLKIETAKVKTEKAEMVRKLNNEIGRLELQLTMASQEGEQSKDYIQTLKRQNNELTEKAAQWSTMQKELKEAQSNIKMLENKIEAEKDSSLIVRSLQSELRLLADLQKENRELREELGNYKDNNVTLFQEKMCAFQEKLMQAEKKNVALAKLQVENEQLEEKLSQWESLFDDDSAIKRSPSVFSRKLSDYQKNEAILTNKLSKSLACYETLEKEKRNLDETIKTLNRRLQRFQQNSPVQENLLKRFQRKVIFLTKERDSCRKLLESYQSETTMGGAALNNEYISQLESINNEYKKVLEKLETDIDDLKKRNKTLQESNQTEMLLSELSELREENSISNARIDELEQRKDILENELSKLKLNKGDAQWSGRIMHLKHNPFDNAVSDHLTRFKQLQEENDYLRKRIIVLEEEGATAADVTGKVMLKLENEGSDSTVKELKTQLAAAERQQRFILENAKIKSTEFREAIYRLTGYRIDVPTAEKYKLSHIYADSRDDYLLFQVNSQGIQVIETEYSKKLTERIELYLHQHDSFPAFLASLTMDLFGQQTYIADCFH